MLRVEAFILLMQVCAVSASVLRASLKVPELFGDPEMNNCSAAVRPTCRGHRAPIWRGGAAPSCSD